MTEKVIIQAENLYPLKGKFDFEVEYTPYRYVNLVSEKLSRSMEVNKSTIRKWINNGKLKSVSNGRTLLDWLNWSSVYFREGEAFSNIFTPSDRGMLLMDDYGNTDRCKWFDEEYSDFLEKEHVLVRPYHFDSIESLSIYKLDPPENLATRVQAIIDKNYISIVRREDDTVLITMEYHYILGSRHLLILRRPK